MFKNLGIFAIVVLMIVAVIRIRQSGYAVYSNTRKAGNGVQVTEYVMGKPSREIVALGYKAKAAGYTLDTI
jgi:hypothetical protein